MNKTMLIGRLGNDPETNYHDVNNPVTNFSFATDESYRDKSGNKIERTEWHRIEAWGKLAEIAQKHFKKGAQMYLEGKIKTTSYEKSGDKRYSTQILLKEFKFLDSNSSNTQ